MVADMMDELDPAKYTEKMSSPKPGCVILLIDRSDSMREPWGAAAKGENKATTVAQIVNEFLGLLIADCTDGGVTRDRVHFLALGYGGDAVHSAWKDPTLAAVNGFVTASELATTQEGQSGSQFVDVVAGGRTPMGLAIQTAAEYASSWVQAFPKSFPPIVLNITDGAMTDVTEEELRRRVGQLTGVTTANGHALLFNCHISAQPNVPTFRFPSGTPNVPDKFAALLFDVSSHLTKIMLAKARASELKVADGARGYMFNAQPQDVVNFLNIGSG